LILISLHRYL